MRRLFINLLEQCKIIQFMQTISTFAILSNAVFEIWRINQTRKKNIIDIDHINDVIHEYKTQNGFLEIHNSCIVNLAMDEIAENIKNTLILNGFNVWYKSTDGDRFLSNDHELFYQNYVDGRSSDF